MIHLTYFRCLHEDKINRALEVSISTSLAVEDSLRCKYLMLDAANLPLNAKRIILSNPTLLSAVAPHSVNHHEAQKLYMYVSVAEVLTELLSMHDSWLPSSPRP